jgi:DnaJ-class molecular chaperone
MLENKNINEAVKPQLNIGVVSSSFNGIGEMCKRCSGDGWVFHSKGGQSGLMKDCPKCDGKGVVKNRSIVTPNGRHLKRTYV